MSVELIMHDDEHCRTINITYPNGNVVDIPSTEITIQELMDAANNGAEVDLRI